MVIRPTAIQTPRFELVALRVDELRALIAGDTTGAGQLLGAEFPAVWPEERDAREGLPWHLAHMQQDPIQQAWRIRAVVDRERRAVVGSISLKGPPNAHGDVEIGWGIGSGYRRQGYASEAAAAVAAWIALQPGVRTISATIPDDNTASRRVAEKLGMIRTSEMRRELPLWQLRTR